MFVYETIKRICKKYRTQFRCDELYAEINYMVEQCFSRIVNTAKQCFQQLEASQDKEMTEMYLGVLNSVIHVIESLMS